MSSFSKQVGNKLWYILIMKYHSMLKRNVLLSHNKDRKRTANRSLSGRKQLDRLQMMPAIT